MDINALKAKLESLEQNDSSREKIDFKKIFWRPGRGSHKFRIVPSMYTPENPFTELLFHNKINRFPIVSLVNYGKQDPVVEFINELKKNTDSESWSLAGKLTPQPRYFAPVIVRGEEELGVRLWSFSKTNFKALVTLASDDDIGDYTDVISGYDLVLDKVAVPNGFDSLTVRLSPKQKPLSEDADEVKLWLSEQPNPMESQTVFDYDYVKRKLGEFLGGVDDEDSTEDDDDSVDTSEDEETESDSKVKLSGKTGFEDVEAAWKKQDETNQKAEKKASGKGKKSSKDYTLDTATEGKKSNVARYDDLFNEDN